MIIEFGNFINKNIPWIRILRIEFNQSEEICFNNEKWLKGEPFYWTILVLNEILVNASSKYIPHGEILGESYILAKGLGLKLDKFQILISIIKSQNPKVIIKENKKKLNYLGLSRE